MKFSVLLPTHNRLDLLKFAIESVIKQSYGNWELIISDNDSSDNVAEHIQQLNENRIKYYKTEEYINVTQNWNNALNNSTGDYVIMLGDDDALIPNCLSSLSKAIIKFDKPDYIYTDAYLFCYPHTHPDYPSGYLQPFYDTYFNKREPYLLNKNEAVKLTKEFLQLNADFKTNMQLSTINRKLINDLATKGEFFQSLFPDFYASITSFFFSKKTLILPNRTVVIGVSPKSHGYFFFNNQTSEAKAALHNVFSNDLEFIKEHYLPGNWLLTGWLSSAYTLAKNHEHEFSKYNINVAYEKYREVIISETMQSYFFNKSLNNSEFLNFIKHLNLSEYSTYLIPNLIRYIRISLLSLLKIRKIKYNSTNISVSSKANKNWITKDYNNILEVVKSVSESPIDKHDKQN